MSSAKSVRIVRNFVADPWKSMHRYADEIISAVKARSAGLDIKVYQPPGSLLSLGTTLGRRILLPAVAERSPVDVVHILDQAYADLLLHSKAAAKIITCHDLEFWRQKKFWNAPVRNRIFEGVTSADAIVVPAKTIRDELVALKPTLFSRIHVVPNGVPADFTPATRESRAALRLELDLGADFVCLHVGTSELPRKNVAFLFEALAHLKAKGISVRLIQAGGKFTPEQYRLLAKSGLLSVTTELGRIGDESLKKWYRAADAVLVPSLYEGFGLPVLEAMACGTPVVCSDIAVFNEITEGTGVALALVPDLWAQRLLILQKSEEARAKAIETGVRTAARFTYSNAGIQLTEIYRAIEPPVSRR
ncbi:MAG: glycosyltransferase family 1 protein [Bdellovibrionia bacterium]